MTLEEIQQIAYANVLIDWKEYSGETFSMTWDEQCKINAKIWNGISEKERERFYELNDKYVYDSLAFYNRKFSKIVKILPFLHKQDTILDFGCGICCDVLMLSLLGYNVEGVDLPTAARAFGMWRMNKYDILSKIHRSIPNKHYNIIYSYDVIEHIKDWKPVINKICSSTNLFIVTWDFDSENGRIPFHYEHNEDEVISEIQNNGFERLLNVSEELPKIFKKVSSA